MKPDEFINKNKGLEITGNHNYVSKQKMITQIVFITCKGKHVNNSTKVSSEKNELHYYKVIILFAMW